MSGKSFAKDICNGVNFQDMSVMRCICQGHLSGTTSQTNVQGIKFKEHMSLEPIDPDMCHQSLSTKRDAHNLRFATISFDGHMCQEHLACLK